MDSTAPTKVIHKSCDLISNKSSGYLLNHMVLTPLRMVMGSYYIEALHFCTVSWNAAAWTALVNTLRLSQEDHRRNKWLVFL
jgi:hypothetical protein